MSDQQQQQQNTTHRRRASDMDDTGAFRMASTADRLAKLERDMATNTKETKETREVVDRVEANTKTLVETFTVLRGGAHMLTWIGHIIKAMVVIAGAIAAFKIIFRNWLLT